MRLRSIEGLEGEVEALERLEGSQSRGQQRDFQSPVLAQVTTPRPRAMYLRTVLRSRSSRLPIAETDSPC